MNTASLPQYLRSTAVPSRIRGPRWLIRLRVRFGADDGQGDVYRVTFARTGRIIEVVTVRARTREAAIEQARRYLFANIYMLRAEHAPQAGTEGKLSRRKTRPFA